MQSLVRLVVLPADAILAMHAGDLEGARVASGLDLPEELLEIQSLWRFRAAQVAEDPAMVTWLVRAVVRSEDGAVVGHAGFHGPPDDRGMVEVGYSTLSPFRGRGYAQSALGALLAEAAARPSVRVVRAAVSPDNDASLAIVGNFGFALVGDQWDEEDGLELVLELPIRAPGAGMQEP